MKKIIGMLSIVATLSISAITFAGAVGGPKFVQQSVPAQSTDYYQLYFRGNELASVEVKGDGDTDIDCYVYDQNRNLVAQDIRSADYCVLNWVPRWTGPFTVFVKNQGSVYNAYWMETN